ncbi:MAG TPA: archease [bacterium]|nr:archease [bacterium]
MTDVSFFEHTADIGMTVRAKTRSALFCKAAEGMMSLILDLKTVRPLKTTTRFFDAQRGDLLLHDWLSEILFLFEQGMAYAFFRVTGDNISRSESGNYRFQGILRGEPVDLSRHDICKEIKAVTRHDFSLQWNGNHWEAKMLFDV